MILDTVRISKKGKEQLIKLKRVTGIAHWNVLCRWAFCVSLAEATSPPHFAAKEMSNIEMSWKTFGGEHAEVYEALLKQRCRADSTDMGQQSLARAFRNHLHRGIAHLASGKRISNMADLLGEVDGPRENGSDTA